MMANSKVVQVSVRVPVETRRQLRVAAAQHDCSVNALIEAVAMHLQDMTDLGAWVQDVQAIEGEDDA